jgi:hypothetical protein
MKRLLLAILGLAAFAAVALAGDKEPRKAWAVLPAAHPLEVSLSIGGYPGYQYNSLICGQHNSTAGIPGNQLRFIYDGYYTQMRTSGTGILDVDWNVSRFFAIGARVGYNHFWGEHSKRGAVTAEQVALLPSVKYALVRRTFFNLYLQGAAGAGWYPGFEELEKPVQFEYQLSVGLAFGKRFFGRLEGGFGSLFCGVAIGAGYRF